MLKHIVFMKFKTGIKEEQIKEMEKALGSLPAKIPEIMGFEFGRDILHSERSYDFALIGEYADLPALARYQNHPDHIPVLQLVRSLCEAIIVVDFTIP